MIVVCCRCRIVGVELDDDLLDEDGGGTLPLVQPVPDGWLPGPGLERRGLPRLHHHRGATAGGRRPRASRPGLHGEFD